MKSSSCIYKIYLSVLGSSGECLPVNRTTKGDDWESMRAGNSEMQSVNRDALFSSAQSEDEEEIFHSAQTSIDNESDDPIQGKIKKEKKTSDYFLFLTQRLRFETKNSN